MGAVAVRFSVRLVALDLVADQVVEREAVVRGHEVDAGRRRASARLVEITAPRQPRSEVRDLPRVAAPEAAHGVAVAIVPLRPGGREVAGLMAAGPEVPGLGDQLDPREHRVAADGAQESPVPLELAGPSASPRQGAGQVEAEPVDVHLRHPVAEAVQDQSQHVRMRGVERVAAAGEVDVFRGVVGPQAVVRPVVDTAQRERRPVTAALGGVVVDDVEDHFDAGGVQAPNHRLELFHAAFRRRREPCVRSKVRQRVVAPVVRQACPCQPPLAGRLVYRQQLDGRHAQVREVADRRVRGQPQAGSAEMRRHVRMPRREALDVDLVDDRLVPRSPRVRVVAPFEGRIENRGQRRERRVVPAVRRRVACGAVDGTGVDRIVPAQGAADSLRVRIEDHLGRVEAVPGARLARAAHPVAVQLPRPDVGQVAVPDEARSAPATRCAPSSRAASGPSKRHNSIFSACVEKMAKLTPAPSQVAPSGCGLPGRNFMPALGPRSVRSLGRLAVTRSTARARRRGSAPAWPRRPSPARRRRCA